MIPRISPFHITSPPVAMYRRKSQWYTSAKRIRGESRQKELRKALSRFAAEHRLCCGMSACYFDAADSPSMRRQAELASGLAVREGISLADADDHYAQLLAGAILSEQNPEIYALSEWNRPEDFDRENGTDYVRTLETYLAHMNRPSPAAAHLYIDRSTLAYRLQKIREILCQDIDDADEIRLLKTAYLVHRLMH